MKTKTLDLTPTWSGILPTLLALLEADSPSARGTARDELARMAKLADRYVASQPAPVGGAA